MMRQGREPRQTTKMSSSWGLCSLTKRPWGNSLLDLFVNVEMLTISLRRLEPRPPDPSLMEIKPLLLQPPPRYDRKPLKGLQESPSPSRLPKTPEKREWKSEKALSKSVQVLPSLKSPPRTASKSLLPSFEAACASPKRAPSASSRRHLQLNKDAVEICLDTDDVTSGYFSSTEEMEKKLRREFRVMDDLSRRAHALQMSSFLSHKQQEQDAFVFLIYNGCKQVREELEDRGHFENKEPQSRHFDLFWSLSCSDIPYGSLSSAQIVNHFPNTAVELGAKVGLMKNLKALDWFDRVDHKSFFPRAYCLHNPWEVQDFVSDFIFVEAKSVVFREWADPGTHPPSVVASAIVSCNRFLNKSLLNLDDLCAIRPDLAKKFPRSCTPRQSSLSGLPLDLTSIIDRIKSDVTQWDMDGNRNVWILKPGHGSRGRGIRVMNDLQSILRYSASRKSSVIAQKYVENPLLVEERKLDLRVWVLVTDWNPLTIWIYKDCYVRLCTEEHTLDNLDNLFAHLCNRCVQKKNGEKYDGGEDEENGCMWSSDTFSEYLEKHFGEGSWSQVWMRIRGIVVQTLHSVQDSVEGRRNCFEWFGFDFLVDSHLGVWILEANISPDTARCTEVLDTIVPAAVSDLFNVILSDSSDELRERRWELVFRGKVVKSEILRARMWAKKHRTAELRINRPYSIRDALLPVVGNAFYASVLSSSAADED